MISNVLWWKKEGRKDRQRNRLMMKGSPFPSDSLPSCPLYVSSHLLDPAVDDFVLMHCVFMPNSQLCPLLMAQYPFCLHSLLRPLPWYTVLPFCSLYCLWYPLAAGNVDNMSTVLLHTITVLLTSSWTAQLTVLLMEVLKQQLTIRR